MVFTDALKAFVSAYNGYCEEEFGEPGSLSMTALESNPLMKVGFCYTDLPSGDASVELVYAPLQEHYTAYLVFGDKTVTCVGFLDIQGAIEMLDWGFADCYDFAVGCFRNLVGEED